MKYFTTLIEYHHWNLKLQRVFSPFNLIFNAEFQKINAEIPFTPSYLEPIKHNNYDFEIVNFPFLMAMFLSLHPMESISFN